MTLTIPTSGDFLRTFARARMAAGTRHVAVVLASTISYDGRHRGAPHGHSAYTMAELRQETGLSERSILNALQELARLFGLVVIKRHHRRHFFRFAGVAGTLPVEGESAKAETDAEDEAVDNLAQTEARVGQTGNGLRVPPYREEQEDNNFPSKVDVDGEASVHRTPWADFIRRFKRGTPAERMDPQYLWTGFCGLNRRHGHRRVPIGWLVGFLRKYPTIPPKARAAPCRSDPASQPISPPPAAATPLLGSLIEMARPAPFHNRHWHQSALMRHIGAQAYKERVNTLIRQYGGTRFGAELAVHGQAVRAGEIMP